MPPGWPPRRPASTVGALALAGARAGGGSHDDDGAAGVAAVSGDRQHGLSDDEIVLLGLVCEGLTNAEIAARLRIAEHVVSTRVARLLHQLGLRNRVQLAVWAVKQGLY